MDSSVSETYGQQEGSAYNGHFGCDCYHPLFCFNQFGDLERAMLRHGNVASADDWRSVLEPVIDRYRDLDIRKFFRGDAAFAIPELYEFLEAEGYHYAIRLQGQPVLAAADQPPADAAGGPPAEEAQRVLPQLQVPGRSLGPAPPGRGQGRVAPGRAVPARRVHRDQPRRQRRRCVNFYNGRGTAEQWIKEGKYAVNWTRLSCHGFEANQVRLQLFVLAYNLGNFLRRLALPRSVRHWTLTTLREKLIKIGAKMVRHARYVTFQLAEVAVPRRLYRTILNRIRRFAAITPRAAPI